MGFLQRWRRRRSHHGITLSGVYLKASAAMIGPPFLQGSRVNGIPTLVLAASLIRCGGSDVLFCSSRSLQGGRFHMGLRV